MSDLNIFIVHELKDSVGFSMRWGGAIVAKFNAFDNFFKEFTIVRSDCSTE